MTDALSILQRYWGYADFRPPQAAIIASVLAGRDTLALLPTGGGKSICYQVPALAQDGLCLVVSPLVALMKDQVETLKTRGIGALLIHAGMLRKDILRTLENARQPYFKFLYVSPERLESALFREYLPALQVNLLAVDEAHCISQWGYDFRPSYLNIAALRQELPDVPVLAVTASATADVQRDICARLSAPGTGKAASVSPGTAATDLHGFTLFRHSFERKNLSYSVFQVAAKAPRLVEILKSVAGSAIVYCKSRKRTTEVASLLGMHGINASFYHAGLQGNERSQRQQAWIDNKTRVMVCTNAFGMGIDKPDVRTVVHMDAPDCLENYYQEAGRCGRDGKRAYAVLLYNEKDRDDLRALAPVRFPSFDTIRQVYEALGNYLQIPVHRGQDCSYNFRLEELVRHFKLDGQQALYALQALESDGWISYNERNFTPSTVVFSTSKTSLYEFYKNHPEHEALLTTLLRTYEGIFDFPAFVSENLLARLLRTDEDTIKQGLQKIAGFGMVQYSPQNDTPQLLFRKNRVATADLSFDLAAFEARKERFVQRLNTLLQYLEITTCRSAFVGRYFGDASAADCGVCDNCLARKKRPLAADAFAEIAQAIKQQVASQPLTAEQLFRQLPAMNKEAVWKALSFLQAENEIRVSADGQLHLAD